MRSMALVVALAATTTAFTANAQDVELTFLSSDGEEVLAPVIAAFEAANPGVTVRVERVPFADLAATIDARIGTGETEIDIVAADTPRVPYMVFRNQLAPLDESVVSQIEALGLNEADLESISHEGVIHSYPLWSSTNLLFYNRAALERAGVEPPSADPNERMTWDELLEKAAAVQAGGGAPWGLMFQQVDRYYQLQPLFESSGAGSGLSGDDMLTPTIASEEWIETAQWYADLFESGIAPRGVSADQTDTMFGSGEIAFFVGGPWAIPRWTESGLTEFGVAPMPYFEGGEPATPTGAWSWAVNPNSDDAEWAHKFLQFATLTGEGSALTVEKFPLPPVHPEGFEIFADRFIANAPEGMAEVYSDIMAIAAHELANTACVRPRTIGFVAFETIMNNAFSDIRNGSDPAEVLPAAEQQLTSAFGRLQ